MAGWIKLHRKVMYCWVYQDKPFSRGQAWIDLILLANHKDKIIPFGNEMVTVGRGTFITSEMKLMERWGWSKAKLRNFLKLLEADQMILKKSDNRKTSITIVEYDTYQDSETAEEPQKDQSETAERPPRDRQLNTNKNTKNDKELKNDKKYIFTPPTAEEVIAYCQERNKGIDPHKWYDFYSAKGWMIGKNKMKDWKAAVRTWESKPDKPKNKYDDVYL